MGPLESLEAAVAAHVAAIHRAATASPAGGGPEWDLLLAHYGVAGLSPAERASIAHHMRLPRGAVPAEVRLVLAGLSRWASGEMDRLRAAGHLAPPALHQRVAELADRETAAYERALGLAPPAPAPSAFVPAPAAAAGAPNLASIFANAQQTSKEVPWAGMKYDAVACLTCVHCGGPQEQPQDFMCKYCRRPIAGAIKPTA